jgi:hypothetical protein
MPMAHEKKLGKFDQLYKRIEGETVDSQPAFAGAMFLVDATTDPEAASYCLVTSGSYNYSVQSDRQTTPAGYKGAAFLLDILALPASGTLTMFIDIRNPCDGEYSAWMQATTIPATGSVATIRKYLLYPAAVDTDSLLTHITQLPVPKEWRARLNVAGGSGSWSYMLGVQYLD